MATEFVQLCIKRNIQLITFVVLIVLLITTNILTCLVSHIVFSFFSYCFVTSKNVCKFSFLVIAKRFIPGFLSVKICGIHFAYIFCTFKTRYKIKTILDKDMPTASVMSRIVYLPFLLIISTFLKYLPCLLQSKVH